MGTITRRSGYTDFNSSASTLTGWIPQLFESKFIEELYENTLVTDLATTKFNGKIKNYGDSVVIPVEPTIQTSDYVIGQDISDGTPTPGNTPGTEAKIMYINQGKTFWAMVDDVDEYQSTIDMMKAYAKAGALGMSRDIDKEVFAWLVDDTETDNIHASNKGTSAGVQSGSYNLGETGTPVNVDSTNALQLVLQAAAVLDEQNVPRAERWIVVPSAFAYMLKDSDIKSVCITGDPKSVLRQNNRSVGNVDGMEIYVSNNLAKTGSGPFEFHCPFGDKMSFAFCSQMTKTSIGEMEKRFASYIKGLNVYGYEVLDNRRLGKLVVSF